MKKWNKPQIFTLGVENTFTDDIMTCNASKHPCHKTGNGLHNDSGNHVAGVEQNGHIFNNGCPDLSHYDANGNPICCCYRQSLS